MNLLGIETSCDETAAAVVAETGDAARPWRIRSNVVASQVAIHREWGGVVPELASRQHLRDICGVVERGAGAGAASAWTDVDAVAVTQGPGPRRVAARRRVVRQGARVVARASRSCRCITSPATSSRSSRSTASCRCRRSCSSCRAATRASISSPSAGRYQLHRPDARRCGGRGVRQGRQAARPRLSGRAGHRSPRARRATTARSRFR